MVRSDRRQFAGEHLREWLRFHAGGRRRHGRAPRRACAGFGREDYRAPKAEVAGFASSDPFRIKSIRMRDESDPKTIGIRYRSPLHARLRNCSLLLFSIALIMRTWDCKMKLSSSWIRLQKITQKIGKSHKSFGNVLRPSEVFLRLLGLQGNEGSKDNHILPMVASGKVESSGAFACLRHWETPTCSQALQLQIPFSDMLPCGRLELGGRRQP
ncbi:hypothetical protein MUK42_06053 [Musa troglodytarum]|uniref:Uncharacterized protein n=1 Tax=Musa troglodytarum TaxID=320322 RepID=A0A9E7KAY2_9LILI|nr:hypothetical protein MUK42_06053 [Musa troglodytarum]